MMKIILYSNCISQLRCELYSIWEDSEKEVIGIVAPYFPWTARPWKGNSALTPI